MSNAECFLELKGLRETSHNDLKFVRLFRYEKEKSNILLRFEADWKQINDAFPSAKEEARSAVDCWAMDQNTAAVFHSMRVLEYGLAAMARDVQVPFSDTQTWNPIIVNIEAAITREQAAKQYPLKNARLQFLSEAAKEFRYFKDGWRNYVSHNKVVYDEYGARSIIEHVRAFMQTISSKLSEEPV